MSLVLLIEGSLARDSNVKAHEASNDVLDLSRVGDLVSLLETGAGSMDVFQQTFEKKSTGAISVGVDGKLDGWRDRFSSVVCCASAVRAVLHDLMVSGGSWNVLRECRLSEAGITVTGLCVLVDLLVSLRGA